MPFDVARTFAERSGENYALHERYMNHQLARTLRTLGFDRNYIRAEGCYLWDDAGARYLDFLSGFGVFQELRAKRTLDRLAILNAARAHVVREGVTAQIPVDQVVLDDVLELRQGDQVT